MPKKKTTTEDRELLSDLGVQTSSLVVAERSPKELRILSGFQEIEKFVSEHGRRPENLEDRDIFERMYAVRLKRIQSSYECLAVLKGNDEHSLLTREVSLPDENPDDEALLSELGADDAIEDGVSSLKHVRSSSVKAAEEVAQRIRCRDFEAFAEIFEEVQAELEHKQRKTIKYQDNADVRVGDLFILDGQKVYVAVVGEQFINDYNRPDRRLRVIYDNGTESDILLRSFQRALNKDLASRRITDPDLGPLFSGELNEGDTESGFIYVLRSHSSHAFITEHRETIHKIGVTTGEVEDRIKGAKSEPTFLRAEVEIVHKVRLSAIAPHKLERLLHRFFGEVRLDLAFHDTFAEDVQPREWFFVPRDTIVDAINKVSSGTLQDYKFCTATATLVRNR